MYLYLEPVNRNNHLSEEVAVGVGNKLYVVVALFRVLELELIIKLTPDTPFYWLIRN